MVRNILSILTCSISSFVLLAIILGTLAYTGITPFGQFTDIILQNQENPSEVFMDESYYDVFTNALNFVLYFIISPIIILTGVTGAIVSKGNEILVGMASSLPMLVVYIIPVFSLRNIIVAVSCIAVTVGCIILVQKNGKKEWGTDPN